MTSTTAEADASDPSYIDYEIFLSPSFSAPSFANSLVLSTNNPTDTPLDLATPLSRVLFDIQEVDSHIHTLTSASALPLLNHTREQTSSSTRIVDELSAQVASLNDSYARLEKEIIHKHEAAEEVRLVSSRLWHTVRLGRAVGRVQQLGRQLEAQMSEFHSGVGVSSNSSSTKAHEDHRAMIRASNTVLTLRVLFAASAPGEEGESLARVNAVNTLRSELIAPNERTIRAKAQQIVREFSMSSLAGSSTYAQTEDTKARTTSALMTLYLLSYIPPSKDAGSSLKQGPTSYVPELLITSLQDYLRTSITSSLTALSRSLGSLPTLDRTLLEISARCQNIITLSILLDSTKPPPLPVSSSTLKNSLTGTTSTGPTASHKTHTTPPTPTSPTNFLHPLLAALETSSLQSHFWRSLGSALVPKVQELVAKGGVQARTLRTNRNSVRDAIRECVIRGSAVPAGVGMARSGVGGKGDGGSGGWEREVAVMVGAVVNQLPR